MSRAGLGPLTDIGVGPAWNGRPTVVGGEEGVGEGNVDPASSSGSIGRIAALDAVAVHEFSQDRPVQPEHPVRRGAGRVGGAVGNGEDPADRARAAGPAGLRGSGSDRGPRPARRDGAPASAGPGLPATMVGMSPCTAQTAEPGKW